MTLVDLSAHSIHALSLLRLDAAPQVGLWIYLLIMVMVMTEGPLSTLAGASAAAAGLLDVRLVLLATIAGNVIGDVLWYVVGYRGGVGALSRLVRLMGVDAVRLDRMCAKLRAHAVKAIIVAKLAVGLIIPTLVAAGTARVHWRCWFPVVFVVETLWSVLLVFLGYHAADAIGRTEHGLKVAGLSTLAVVVVVVAAKAITHLRRAPRPPAAGTGTLQQLGNDIQA